jgi:hypothetical protein
VRPMRERRKGKKEGEERKCRSSLVRGPPEQSLRVDRRVSPPHHSTPSGGPVYELEGVQSSAHGAAQGVGTENNHDIKEVAFRHQTVMYPLFVIDRCRKDRKKEYAEDAQHSTDAPLSLTAHIPPPSGKARFKNPCRFLERRDGLAAPHITERHAPPRGRMRHAARRNCPTITICVDVRSLAPEREWKRGTHAHLLTEHEDHGAHAAIT